MTSSTDSLRSTDWRTLDLIGSAFIQQLQDGPIEIRQVVGWPFAWLLHPGIDNGLAVTSTRILLHLEQAGLLDITQPDANNGSQFLTLTKLGLVVALERAQVKRLTDLSLDVLDYSDGAGWH